MAQQNYQMNDSHERIDGANIAIIQAGWHKSLTDVCVARCREILVAHGANVSLHILPGTMELPLAAQTLASSKKNQAIIAFGIIVKGQTDHYETIRDFAVSGLGRVMLDQKIPVINEILPVHDIEHAKSRCRDDQFNKGIEAAHACIDMVAWMRVN